MARLIFTSDSASWSKKDKNIFIGKWCVKYDQKNLIKEYDYEFLPSFCPSQSQKNEDLVYLRRIEKKILKDLAILLNETLGVDHRENYWESVIGHWLMRYCRTMFNRYQCLKIAIDKIDDCEYPVVDIIDDTIPQNEHDFIFNANENWWNQLVFQLLLKELNQNYKKRLIEKDPFIPKIKNEQPSKKWSIKKILRVIFSFLTKFFYSDSDAFLHSTYLPKHVEFKLSLLLKQWPQFWTSPKIQKLYPDKNLREMITFDLKNCDEFECLLRKNLKFFIPLTFFEGHQLLVKKIDELPWPKKPKFIFTSNSFDTDTIFKMWSAQKKLEGSLYVTGQHGNNYGTHFYAGTDEWPERSSADFFISWGWSKKLKNIIPAFNFKINPNHVQKYNKLGNLLLIENSLQHMSSPWDVYEEHEIYQEHQFKFVEALPQIIKNELTIRLHGGFKSLSWFDDLRWKDKDSKLKIETGSMSINELITQSRLVVHSYDSTGILETLSLNIPTLCFWQGGFDHLLDDVRSDYEILKKANIFFDNPCDCAKFIENNWDKLDDWWLSEKVQDARNIFCSKYSKLERQPASALSKIFNEILNGAKL